MNAKLLQWTLNIVGVLLLFFATGSSFSDENLVVRDSGDFKIYNKGYIAVLEHSCIKHLKNGNLRRANEVFEVANWQCSEKKYVNVNQESDVTEFNHYFQEAIEARKKHEKQTDTPWLCYPTFEHLKNPKRDFYGTLGRKIYTFLKQKQVSEESIWLVMSQVILESDWGRKIKGNSLFNIKGKYRGQSLPIKTREQLGDGQWIEITDVFRKYPDIESSIEDYLNVLKSKWEKAYKALFSSKDNARLFLDGLNAGKPSGYATDKSYIDKIDRLFQQTSLAMRLPPAPVYLKCVGREDLLDQISRRKELCLEENRFGFCF